MRKSFRYSGVLFFLSLLAIVAALGTDIATPLGVGGPLEDVYLFSGVDGAVNGIGERAYPGSVCPLSVSTVAFSASDGASLFFVGKDGDGLISNPALAEGSATEEAEEAQRHGAVAVRRGAYRGA